MYWPSARMSDSANFYFFFSTGVFGKTNSEVCNSLNAACASCSDINVKPVVPLTKQNRILCPTVLKRALPSCPTKTVAQMVAPSATVPGTGNGATSPRRGVPVTALVMRPLSGPEGLPSGPEVIYAARPTPTRDAVYLTLVGEAMASLSAGHASRALTMLATALNVTFPALASSLVKV